MSNQKIVFTGLTKREYIKMLEDGVQYAKCINCGRTSEDKSAVIFNGNVAFREMEFFTHKVAISDEVTVNHLLCLECSIIKEKNDISEESELSNALSSDE